jgi:DNA-binding SARP family transcriptional activator/DNA-binding transcriptional ArsR family regulator
MISSSSHHICLLGRFTIAGPDGPVALPQGQIPFLLAYLLLHPVRPLSRSELAEILWPEAAPGQARRRLSDLLYRARSVLGETWLVTTRDTVQLRDPGALWVDVWQFEEHAGREEPEAWAQAVDLYAGDLLPDLDADWILVRRVYLQDRYLGVLERLAQHEEAAGAYAQALTRYRRMAELDPLREAVLQGIMRCLARQGRMEDALKEYAAFTARLQTELDVPPGETTQALAQRLQTERSLQRPPSTGQPPFVGRLEERRRLLTYLDRAYQGRGGVVVVLGEAGIGKSRLLGELAEAANWRGWQLGWGYGEPQGYPAPYAPLPQALSGVLSLPRLQQLTQLLQPHWLHLLRPLLPPTWRATAPVPAVDSPPTDPGQDIPVAFARLLQGLDRIAPHLLLLEDVHWADPGLWPLLDALQPSLQKMGILLILSARPEELRDQPDAWDRVLAWDREGSPVLHLRGLAETDLREMLRHAGWEPGPENTARELLARGQGNPLLTLSLLETREGDVLPHPTVHQVAHQRLSRLPQQMLERLEGAAILGERFAYEDWQALCQAMGIPVQDLPRIAGALEQMRILVLSERGYRFAHETLRAAAIDRIAPERRQAWHRAALQLFRRRGDWPAELLLYHAEGAGDTPAIAYYALEAGEKALIAAAFPAALAHADRALAVLPPEQWTDSYRACRLQVRTLERLERWKELAEPLARLVELAARLEDPQRQAQAALHQSIYLQAIGQVHEARSWLEQSFSAAHQVGDEGLEAALLLARARLEIQQGEYDQARTYAEQAQAHYQALHQPGGLAEALNVLGTVADSQGRFAERLALHDQAAQIYRRNGDLHGEVRTLAMLGGAYLSQGQFAEALATHQRALELCRELGDQAGAGRNLSNLGGIAMRLGRVADSLDYYEQALAISRSLGNRTRVGVDLNNLGSAYLSLHRFDEALRCLDEALVLAQETGFARLEGFAQYCRGQAFLRMEDLAGAQAALQASLEVRQALGEPFTALVSAADLANVAARRGDLETGEAAFALALSYQAELTNSLPPDNRLGLWLAGYQIRRAQGQEQEAMNFLLQALDTWEEQMTALSPEERESFAREMYYSQQLQDARERHTRRTTAWLARTDAPTGRPLTSAERVQVTWTLEAPEDHRLAADPGARRRQVLARLLQEAAAQGGAPTATDLAQALGVSRRTILRDMRALAASGLALSRRTSTRTQ